MSALADDRWRHLDRTSFEEVHAGVLDLLPPLPAKVLDVGAGTGRDARALAGLGYEVTAVEPSPLLFQDGSRREGPPVEWLHDELPKLEHLGSRLFDLILVSAVWMYVEPAARPSALKRLSRLLRVNSVLVLTTRPALPTDDHGAFWEATASALLQAAEAARLVLVRERADLDSLGRNVAWQTFVFRHSA